MGIYCSLHISYLLSLCFTWCCEDRFQPQTQHSLPCGGCCHCLSSLSKDTGSSAGLFQLIIDFKFHFFPLRTACVEILQTNTTGYFVEGYYLMSAYTRYCWPIILTLQSMQMARVAICSCTLCIVNCVLLHIQQSIMKRHGMLLAGS